MHRGNKGFKLEEEKEESKEKRTMMPTSKHNRNEKQKAA